MQNSTLKYSQKESSITLKLLPCGFSPEMYRWININHSDNSKEENHITSIDVNEAFDKTQ